MIIVTVVAVSIDAYVAGLSIGYGRAGELKIIYIAAFSFFLPWLFMTVAQAEAWLNPTAACILILLGFKGLLSDDGSEGLIGDTHVRKMSCAEATLLGISLSVDSVFGSALFSGELSAPLMCAMIFCAQYIMLALGRFTSRLKAGVNILSPIASLVLILLGISRFF